jgi:hypothetical protein
MSKKSVVLLFPLTVYLVFATMLSAQIKSATITGSITDQSGAVVAHADVSIVNEETGVATEVKSSDSGLFTAPYLPAGSYSVSVSRAGFSPYKKTGITLGTSEAVRVNVELRTGSVTETVVVRSEASQLQTENASVEEAINSRTIQNIPNLTSNPLQYAVLQAGVAPRAALLDTTSPQSFGIGWGSRREFSAFNVNGGSAFTNDIQLDGLSVQGSAWNEATVLPNPDALQEVRVISNNFSAEYGRGQGVVTMTTKSGSNAFHGGLNYNFRNEALNANSFGNNAQDLPKGPFKVNQFGGYIGGPIRKDKLFFFVSYEHLIHSDAANWLLTVPTALERQGDFSQTKIPDNSGNPVAVQLFDPFTVISTNGSNYQHAPIPNSIITNPDPRALLYYAGFPLPNRTPDDSFGTNNFFVQKTRQYRRNSLNSRIDYKMGKHSIYGTGGFEQGHIKTPRPFGDDSPFYQPPTNGWSSELDRDLNPYGAIGDTIVLSPSLVLDVRYGINRINNDSVSAENSSFDYAAYGMPNKVLPVVPFSGVALDIGFPGRYSSLSNSIYQQKRERQTNHLLAGSVTKILNRWTLKAGSENRIYLSNYTDFENGGAKAPGGDNGAGGNFTTEWTDASGSSSSLNTTPQQNGFGGAATMLGVGAFVIRQGFPVRPAFAQKLFALYSQNDWRATSKLTLNFGLRWEVQPGPTERFNRTSSIDFNADNPFFGKAKYVFPGTDGYSRNLWDTKWANFQPRVGAAYAVSQNTVLRGGYGRTYLPTNTGYYNGPFTYGAGNFSAWTQGKIFGTNPNGVPVGHFWDDAPTQVVPEAGATQSASMYGQSAYMFDRHNNKNGFTDQWNFFVERRFTNAWFASLGYVGSRGRDLQNGRFPINSIQRIPESQLQQFRSAWIASNGTDNPAFDQVANPYQPTSGSLTPFSGYLGNATIQQWQTMQPYPMLGDMTLQATNGFANYNALQAHVNHAFAGGFQMQAHYTWSKATEFTWTELQGNQSQADINSIGWIDLRNLKNNKGLAVTDIPHRFVGVLTYDLPIGAGRRFDPRNRFLQAVVGNWTIGSVITLQSGLPNGAYGFDGSLNNRGDLAAGESAEVPSNLQRWYDGNTSVTLPDGRIITPCNHCFLKYNPDLFTGRVVTLPNGQIQADQLWYGSAGRTYGFLRGPGRNNTDLTINRQFKIRESMQFELVANFTNAFNHTQFSNNLNLGTGTVTTPDPAHGLVAGMNSNSNFGTRGLGTYEPRQITFSGRLRF